MRHGLSHPGRWATRTPQCRRTIPSGFLESYTFPSAKLLTNAVLLRGKQPHTTPRRDGILFLESIAGPTPKEQMACIVETNRGLLIAALLEAGFPVYPVHPRAIDRRRAPSGAKTDLIEIGRAHV